MLLQIIENVVYCEISAWVRLRMSVRHILIAGIHNLHEDVSLTGKSGKGELRRVVK